MGEKLIPVPQKRNANRHTQRGMQALERSLSEDGWIGAITVAADGETFDGSARVEKTAENGMLEDAIYVHTDGSKPVIVVRDDIASATDERAVRLGIAANRVSSLNLSWEPDVLKGIAEAGVDLSGLFTDLEWADVSMPDLPEPGAGGDEFDPSVEDGPTRTALGQLWSIGPHRLFVGDCTDAANVARLMGQNRAAAMVSDSPYGISQEGIENDDPEGLRALFDGMLAALPMDSGIVINFQSTRLFPVWLDALRAAGQKFERMLWLYKAAQNTYPWRGWLLTSEAILVSTVGAGAWNDHHPYAHDCYYVSEVSGEIPEGLGWHASVKPMSVVTDLMQRVSSTDDIVYDPFLGSGTAIIAAHRTGRRCFGIELSEKYCDVILRRASAEGLECSLIEA